MNRSQLLRCKCLFRYGKSELVSGFAWKLWCSINEFETGLILPHELFLSLVVFIVIHRTSLSFSCSIGVLLRSWLSSSELDSFLTKDADCYTFSWKTSRGQIEMHLTCHGLSCHKCLLVVGQLDVHSTARRYFSLIALNSAHLFFVKWKFFY